MKNLITIGLPSKGRLKEKSIDFFNKKGFTILQSDKERNYFATIENKPNIKIPNTGLFTTTNEIELLIGQNWLARIGSLAIIFGIGFFIKAAIDSNWISNLLIILIGAIFGFGFVLIGYLLNTKLSFYSRTLTGLGIGILYITTYSSFTAYDLFNIYIGSIIVFLISILGNYLA